jgi:dipeptidyl aminopeptidase/acylaminoacyl peptidase
MFAFYGRRDSSAPFADAERMVAALRQAGARVTLVIEDDAGHDIPDAETLKVYFNWVHSALGC